MITMGDGDDPSDGLISTTMITTIVISFTLAISLILVAIICACCGKDHEQGEKKMEEIGSDDLFNIESGKSDKAIKNGVETTRNSTSTKLKSESEVRKSKIDARKKPSSTSTTTKGDKKSKKRSSAAKTTTTTKDSKLKREIKKEQELPRPKSSSVPDEGLDPPPIPPWFFNTDDDSWKSPPPMAVEEQNADMKSEEPKRVVVVPPPPPPPSLVPPSLVFKESHKEIGGGSSSLILAGVQSSKKTRSRGSKSSTGSGSGSAGSGGGTKKKQPFAVAKLVIPIKKSTRLDSSSSKKNIEHPTCESNSQYGAGGGLKSHHPLVSSSPTSVRPDQGGAKSTQQIGKLKSVSFLADRSETGADNISQAYPPDSSDKL